LKERLDWLGVEREEHKASSKIRGVDRKHGSDVGGCMDACMFVEVRPMLVSTSFYRRQPEKVLQFAETNRLACYFQEKSPRISRDRRSSLCWNNILFRLTSIDRNRVWNRGLRQQVALVSLSFFDCLRSAFGLRCCLSKEAI
jgi:hypothetical protein